MIIKLKKKKHLEKNTHLAMERSHRFIEDVFSGL